MKDNIRVNVQSSIRIEDDEILYFDPWQIEEEIHDADVIFITHEHSDHFSPIDIAKVKNDDTILVAPESMKDSIYKECRFEASNLIFLKPGIIKEIGKLVVETVPAYNKLKPFHQKSKEWLGYVVNMEGRRYFVAGDTDVTEENKCVKCDVAILPIGGHFTMDKKGAKDLVAAIRPEVVVPTHYGEVVGSPDDGKDFAKMLEEWPVEVRVLLN